MELNVFHLRLKPCILLDVFQPYILPVRSFHCRIIYFLGIGSTLRGGAKLIFGELFELKILGKKGKELKVIREKFKEDWAYKVNVDVICDNSNSTSRS